MMDSQAPHGVLHLFGYDRELGAAQEAAMKAEEARSSSALIAGGLPCVHEGR